MPRRARTVLVVGLAVLLVGVVVVVGVRAWRAAHRTDLAQAIALSPAGVERFSWTDWAGVRREVGADVDARSTAGDVSDFLDRAYDRDLSSTSALIDSAAVLQEQFGFSPASVEWELFGQGEQGASVLLRLGDGVDMDDVADTLAELGYTRPKDASGVWDGGEELVARIGGGSGLNPEFQYLALDADARLVVASDTRAYAGVAARAAAGKGDPMSGLEDVTAALDRPLAAAVYTGADACRELAMSQADDSDQQQADQLVARAGTISPLASFGMGLEPGGAARVAMGFENADQARDNADSRARLARGPAVGQGGDFADRFRLTSAAADGDVVVLDLAPEPGTYVLSDLSTGPVLYATC